MPATMETQVDVPDSYQCRLSTMEMQNKGFGMETLRQPNPARSAEEDSDSTDDGDSNKPVDVEALQASIFGNYGIKASKVDEDIGTDAGVAKIRGLLVASRSRGMVCLICLERVKGTDFIWDCKSECHAIFHLTCIQSWAKQSLDAVDQRAASRPVGSGQESPTACWHCPKCRAEYSRWKIPREYTCFCGKEVNPAPDPWLAPHTCGEKCGKELAGDCGHECKLLCHPGPCPPCPQLVDVPCFCRAKSETRRCGRRKFSCLGACEEVLLCGNHECEKICHDGSCPPCTRTGMYSCRCKSEVTLRRCIDSDYQCERPCGRELNCRKHYCEKGCHAGPCGECELAKARSCPCGKVQFKGVDCENSVPTCGSTCEKPLGCSLHKCQERCHPGPCNSTCRVIVFKACHCGSLKKQVPCYQELQCERKCQRIRDCTRHACRRRCCDGDCPPCSEICGKKLRCGNHKCPSPCHRGVCAPCPVSVTIACACGMTSYEVPCGMEKNQKPPACSSVCGIPQRCIHGANCEPHFCHYGECPPCLLVCGDELPCHHKCQDRCHGARPPPNPEYTLKRKKKTRMREVGAEGTPCPPCLEPVVRQCLGQHAGMQRTMICSVAKDFQCESLCGNLLDCGNHCCGLPCHPVKDGMTGDSENLDHGNSNLERMSSSDECAKSELDIPNSCEQCGLHCQKERDFCSHPCPLPCHSGECPPCEVLLKKRCHCDTMVHVLDCETFSKASESDRTKMLSCGGPCHRKLPNCSHMCSDICHPGLCPMASNCQKKVVVRCGCQRLRKEMPCMTVQSLQSSGKVVKKDGLRGALFVGVISCDQECLRLLKEKQSKEEFEQSLPTAFEDSKVIEQPTNTIRRRKGRQKEHVQHEATQWQSMKATARRWFVRMSIFFLVFLVLWGSYKGLYELNAWMNRRDSARMRRQLRSSPRFV